MNKQNTSSQSIWQKAGVVLTDNLEKLKKGDEKAFDAFINEHQARVYRIALSLVKNPQDAEDIAQETFVKVYMSISSSDTSVNSLSINLSNAFKSYI